MLVENFLKLLFVTIVVDNLDHFSDFFQAQLSVFILIKFSPNGSKETFLGAVVALRYIDLGLLNHDLQSGHKHLHLMFIIEN